jgi:hypothetical protein
MAIRDGRPILSDAKIAMLTRPFENTNGAIEQPSSKTGRRRLLIVAVFCCFALITGLITAYPKQFMHQVEISLVRQPTPYTQLFFSNPGAIPGHLLIRRPNRFTFTVVNNQGQSEIYRYAIIMSTAKTAIVANRGTLTIRNDESSTRTVTVVPKSRRSRYLITIVLEPSGQSIHFYGETS